MTKKPTNDDAEAEFDENAAESQNDESIDTVQALEKQVSELKDKVLREMAEIENLRRRSAKEKEDTAKYAVSSFAKELLSVADNFDRALDASHKTSDDPVVKNLIIGIEAIQRQLISVFERFSIRKLETNGAKFDPNLHQVMMEVENPNLPAGTIIQTLQSGYTIGDRLLREALVYVSKGSNKYKSEAGSENDYSDVEHIDKTC
ncbi:MAG: nucleotide exchange factor GrpE [Alphaproteobacteria bacterium]|nr:nucleotide exchange factor GrpE [Alphaproteobacteria bacterium]MCL2505537.1 nucleotide exchange factor GrpE [Alphaproteobacteria bacterium]